MCHGRHDSVHTHRRSPDPLDDVVYTYSLPGDLRCDVSRQLWRLCSRSSFWNSNSPVRDAAHHPVVERLPSYLVYGSYSDGTFSSYKWSASTALCSHFARTSDPLVNRSSDPCLQDAATYPLLPFLYVIDAVSGGKAGTADTVPNTTQQDEVIIAGNSMVGLKKGRLLQLHIQQILITIQFYNNYPWVDPEGRQNQFCVHICLPASNRTIAAGGVCTMDVIIGHFRTRWLWRTGLSDAPSLHLEIA